MEITVTAQISLTFDTDESFVKDVDMAQEEMLGYLATGPNPGEFDIHVTTSD